VEEEDDVDFPLPKVFPKSFRSLPKVFPPVNGLKTNVFRYKQSNNGRPEMEKYDQQGSDLL
jgi:hypothetical protein